MAEPDLLTIDRGLIVAPAGCGKTHLITEALRRHEHEKPILVLTHTNAGVAALRHRLIGLSVPKSAYRVATIDGWAMRLVSTFPERSNYDAGAYPKRPDYLKIRRAGWSLLKAGHVTDILKANYSRLLVDEYQDCSLNQHGVVYYAAAHFPTCVLGDPMQAIFGFGGDGLADWEEHVCKHFPLKGQLNTPWHWRNADNEILGEWLLKSRKLLQEGTPIDLSKAPEPVRWVQLFGDREEHQRLVDAARCKYKAKGETTLVIGDSRSAASRYQIAKNVPGIITVEPVDLKDLTTFALTLDLNDGHAVSHTLEFASSVTTNVGVKAAMARLETLSAGREKNPASDMEKAAINLEQDPTLANVAKLLSECSRQTECRTFRPAVLRACLRAISTSAASVDVSFEDAAIQVREENRAIGRQLPQNAIGSTLLLKGLEADHVIVLNAYELDAKNLYVAMTRGAKTVTLCSPKVVLQPAV